MLHPRRIIEAVRENVRFDYQNLNRRPGDRDTASGPGWVEGRCWLRLFDRRAERRGVTINPSWSLWSNFCHAYLEFDHNDDNLSLSVAFPPAAFWLNIGGLLPRRFKKYGWGKKTGVSIHDWSIFIDIWRDDSGWSSKAKWWRQRHFSVNVLDKIFGRYQYEQRELDTVRTKIAMPEATYPVEIKKLDCRWTRPRWPWTWHRLVRMEVTPTEFGVPVPGKGENSWDCGEDACYGSLMPAATYEEAIGRFVQHVMRDRIVRAGLDWTPKEQHPVRPPGRAGPGPDERCQAAN